LLKVECEQVSAVAKVVCGARKGYCGDMLSVQGWSMLLSEDGKGKRYISPVTGLEWPRGFQEVKVPRFHDSGTGWW